MINTKKNNVDVKMFTSVAKEMIHRNPVAKGVLVSMTPAGRTHQYGGQIVTMTERRKRCFSDVFGLSFECIEETFSQLVDKNIIKCVKTDVYQVNPYLYGSGEMEDINRLRKSRRWRNETKEEGNKA